VTDFYFYFLLLSLPHRRARIKATSEEPFQSYAQCLQTTGNNLKKCADLHDQLLKAFEGAKQ